MKYPYLFFDLDGTLTDSGPGIMRAVTYALSKVGIENPEKDTLRKFIGPPLADSFMKYYGLSREAAIRGIQDYREYYNDKGVYENRVYEGIFEMLQAVKASGRKVVIATSKPCETTADVLNHFGLMEYVDFLGCATMDGSRSKKSDVIDYTIHRLAESTRRKEVLGLSKNVDASEIPVAEENIRLLKEKILMVGDRDQDICGAKENGIDSVGVLYGFGDREELTEAGADYMVDSPAALKELILEFDR